MKKSKLLPVTLCLLFVALFSAIASPVFAQGEIVIASDSSSGTYHATLAQIIKVCSAPPQFVVKEAVGVSGGAVGNLQALLDNEVGAALLHSDVYLAKAGGDEGYQQIKTLLSLYPEPVHIVALKNSGLKKGGHLGYGGTAVEINSLQDAQGFTIGAAGGGVITARALQGQGRGGFQVAEYGKGAEVLAALEKGDVVAALFVGAQPLGNIAKLDSNKYKLIPVGDDIASRVSGWYREAKLNYKGLASGPVKTIAPMALIMTREYKTAAKRLNQAHFRQCFYDHLDELQDNGTPQWRSVKPGDHGIPIIPWYEVQMTSTMPEQAQPVAQPVKHKK